MELPLTGTNILVPSLLEPLKLYFLAHLNKVQEELLYYPRCGVGIGIGVSKMFCIKVFYVMGKALTGFVCRFYVLVTSFPSSEDYN